MGDMDMGDMDMDMDMDEDVASQVKAYLGDTTCLVADIDELQDAVEVGKVTENQSMRSSQQPMSLIPSHPISTPPVHPYTPPLRNPRTACARWWC